MASKYSKQRELVKETVLKNRKHLSADQVYGILKEEYPSISLGTVYRNLNGLVETGVVKRIPVPDSGDRFDGEIYEHYHMICQSCKQIFDLKIELLKGLDEQIKSETGFLVENHELMIKGICAQCQSKKVEN